MELSLYEQSGKYDTFFKLTEIRIDNNKQQKIRVKFDSKEFRGRQSAHE